MIGAIISFTAMAVAGRALGDVHDTFEIMTYRSLFGFVLVIAIASAAGTMKQITFRNIPLHTLRNVCHFFGQNLWFFAVGAGTVPLAQIFALEFTTPIWATFLAAFFLGERLTIIRLLAAGIGFAGALIVANPWGGFELSPALVAAAFAALGFAGAAVATRALVRTETITCVLFYLTVIQAVLGLGFSLFDGQMGAPTGTSLPWLLIVAVCGLVAHFCITKALSIAPAGVVMPIDFARLPIIAAVGMMFYNEPLQLVVFVGAILIFAANTLNLRSETLIYNKSKR